MATGVSLACAGRDVRLLVHTLEFEPSLRTPKTYPQ